MTVSLQTKKIKGLHENDFIVAEKLDAWLRIASGQEQTDRQIREVGRAGGFR